MCLKRHKQVTGREKTSTVTFYFSAFFSVIFHENRRAVLEKKAQIGRTANHHHQSVRCYIGQRKETSSTLWKFPPERQSKNKQTLICFQKPFCKYDVVICVCCAEVCVCACVCSKIITVICCNSTPKQKQRQWEQQFQTPQLRAHIYKCMKSKDPL